MAEQVVSPEVDLPKRSELRFVLPQEQASHILQLLESEFEPISYSDRGVTRTIYFNNQEHEIPWGFSLKARQYFHGRSNPGGTLDPEEVYLIEVKETISETERSKRRHQMTLSEATDFLHQIIPSTLSRPVRPYILDEYNRQHFIPKGIRPGEARVTVDLAPTYFLIDEVGSLQSLGEEPSVRVEVKAAPGFQSTAIDILLQNLDRLGGRPVISKKSSVYNLEGRPTKELSEVEIESKLAISNFDPYGLFNIIAAQMRAGMGDFFISDEFPFIAESGSINSYYLSKESGDEGVKFLARPTVARAVLKSETEIVDDPYELGCVLIRRETKGEHFPLAAGSYSQILERLGRQDHQLIGELERLRKAFWARSRKTQRVYHVSIDRCRANSHLLYQIEVEYTGTKGRAEDRPLEAITQEVADLTRTLLAAYPESLKPTTLTKLAWLKSLN